jgi:hypothetical protein
MAGLRVAVCILLVAVLTLPIGTGVAAQDREGGAADDSSPGLLILEVDGLSEPMLRTALTEGAMPFIDGLIADGSHTSGSWHTTAASTTTVTQAGVLHGAWRQIPGFRWWDREQERLIDFLDPGDARMVEERISGPDDLLAGGGASIANIFTGGASRTALTASRLGGMGLPKDVLGYLLDPGKAARVAGGLLDGMRVAAGRVFRGESVPFELDGIKRKAAVPILGPALEWALVDAVAAAAIQEVERSTPILYATFSSYDEVGHYAGPDHPAAMDTLTHIDDAIRSIVDVARAGSRPYELVLLSDHGQTAGAPFATRYGEAMPMLVNELVAPGSAEPIVAASGNLAHIYLGGPERLTLEQVQRQQPGLMAGLISHPGVGVVVLREADGGLIALGADGHRDLIAGHVEGVDPIAHYGPTAAESLANIAASRDAGDLVVVSLFDEGANEVASFEPQIGSHGGIGGPQTQAFLLYPSALEPGEPLVLEGVDAVGGKIREWRDLLAGPRIAPASLGLPPKSLAHLGEEACVVASVVGAVGELCARRDRFGATWTLELIDNEADGRIVSGEVSLDVEAAPDPTQAHRNERGPATPHIVSDTFSPRIGASIESITLTTCVVVRFGPDRCGSTSVDLPQLASQGSPEQLARLRSLVFDHSLDEFMATYGRENRTGVDRDFDWGSDGCSAGRLADLVEDRLQAACLRHDFAYRNFGSLFLDPTDDVRARVDEQLEADATALGQGRLASGLLRTLRQFGGPSFYGMEPRDVWSVPEFIDLG